MWQFSELCSTVCNAMYTDTYLSFVIVFIIGVCSCGSSIVGLQGASDYNADLEGTNVVIEILSGAIHSFVRSFFFFSHSGILFKS